MSNGLTKDEVSAVAQKAGCAWLHEPLAQRFYTLCRAPLVAEVERLTFTLNQEALARENVSALRAQLADEVDSLKAERDDWKARALKAEQAEPEWNDENVITYCIARGISSAKAFTIGATHPQATHPAPRTAGDIPEHVALVCEAYDFAQFSNVEQLNQLPVSVFNALHKVLEDLYRRTYTPPQPAAQELDCATTGVCARSGLYAPPPGAVPVVEKLVEALSLPCDRWNRRQFEITRAAIAAGQKFIKENGK